MTSTPVEVNIPETGERFVCRPGENVLKAMERLNRRGIPVGCRGGGCGVCRIRVRRGEYAVRRMSRTHVSEEEQNAGVALACCVTPLTDLELEVLGRLRVPFAVVGPSPLGGKPRQER